MNDTSTYDLIARYLSNEANEEEKQQVAQLLQSDVAFKAAFQDSQHIWEKANSSTEEVDVEAAWQTFSKRIHVAPKQHKPIYKQLWSIAAALFMIVGAGVLLTKVYLNTGDVSVYTSANEIKEVTLPDGSVVTLNHSSGITYAKKMNGDTRKVKLSGEAFFKVQRDETKPFLVKTAFSQTEVLGTSFNLKSDSVSGYVELVVATGKVKFTGSNSIQSMILTAGKAAYITNQGKTLEAFEPDENATAWKNRKLVFNDASFKDVVSSLEHYFNIQIKVENNAIYACRLTAEFEQPKLKEVLDIIGKTLNLTYTIEQSNVSIAGKGCK